MEKSNVFISLRDPPQLSLTCCHFQVSILHLIFKDLRKHLHSRLDLNNNFHPEGMDFSGIAISWIVFLTINIKISNMGSSILSWQQIIQGWHIQGRESPGFSGEKLPWNIPNFFTIFCAPFFHQ